MLTRYKTLLEINHDLQNKTEAMISQTEIHQRKFNELQKEKMDAVLVNDSTLAYERKRLEKLTGQVVNLEKRLEESSTASFLRLKDLSEIKLAISDLHHRVTVSYPFAKVAKSLLDTKKIQTSTSSISSKVAEEETSLSEKLVFIQNNIISLCIVAEKAFNLYNEKKKKEKTNEGGMQKNERIKKNKEHLLKREESEKYSEINPISGVHSIRESTRGSLAL